MIYEANNEDFDNIWDIFNNVVQSGDAYVYSPMTSKESAFNIWMKRPIKTFVFKSNQNEILGTYYIKENRPDLGSHVCRCGFMVAPLARKQGIAQQMCYHSFDIAKSLGFRGMQLGYVVSTNKASVNLWHKMGFDHVGTVPNAFQHQVLGDVDVFIFYKSLAD